MIDINGMAHVILTVSQFDKAYKFYIGLLPEFGMTKVNDRPDFLYHVGARTAIGLRRCNRQFAAERFEQFRVGLHHICLLAKSREAVDQTAALAASLGTNIARGPEERDWAPGCYYVLFEDPYGICLEANHLPGTGLLNTNASFGSADDYVRTDGKDLTDHR